MYLKHNVKLAPYLWNWYAWSHLIPPHTAAMNIVDRHMKIMESFVAYPDMHYEAIHTRGMVGGPFINLPPNKQPEIAHLLENTKQDCADLITLDSTIKQFDRTLQDSAVGGSLEGFYAQLPMTIKGMVELVYDQHCHPQLRFIEYLLYQKYYSTENQFLILSEVNNDDRPFCLSTPYVSDQNGLKCEIPFSSGVIDQLMAMKLHANDPKQLIEGLNIKADDVRQFLKLFTDVPPSREGAEFTEPGVKIRYFGHACVLLQTNDLSILIDPVLGYNYDGKQVDRLTYMDIPEQIDYVLITHNHQDHFLFEVLLQLRHRIKNIVVPRVNTGAIVDPSLKLILKQLGFSSIVELDQFDSIALGCHGKIVGVPFLGEHADLDIRSKLAYHIQLCDLKMIFMADSNNLDPQLYEYIFDCLGQVDLLFIGMECVGAPASWLYGPLFTKPLNRDHDRSRRLSGSNTEKASRIVKRSGCKEAYVYAMGMEPWLGYIMAVDYQPTSKPILESDNLVQYCRQNQIISERLFGKKQWIFPQGKYYQSHQTSRRDDYAIR